MQSLSISFIEHGRVVAQAESEDAAFMWLSGRHMKSKHEYHLLLSEWKSHPGREIRRCECVVSRVRTSLTDERLFIVDNGLGH